MFKLVGFLLGFWFLDNFGRRIPALLSLLTMFFLSLYIASFVKEQAEFMVLKGFYSIAEGLAFSAISILFIEIVPMKRRGTIMSFFGLFYVIGEMLSLLVVYIGTDNLKDRTKAHLPILSAVIALLSFLLLLFTLDESPRYNLVKGNFEEAFKTLNRMFKVNFRQVSENDLMIGKEIEAGLKQWSKEYYMRLYRENPGRIKSLFTISNWKMTLIIWYIWIVNNFCFFGIFFLMPKTLEKIKGKKLEQGDILKSFLW